VEWELTLRNRSASLVEHYIVSKHIIYSSHGCTYLLMRNAVAAACLSVGGGATGADILALAWGLCWDGIVPGIVA
jgi:hypothetical protein